MHSYLYYEKDINVIEDFKFDKMMTNLDVMRSNYPEEFKKSIYYEDYKSWEEGSGSSLNYDVPRIRKWAKILYNVS